MSLWLMRAGRHGEHEHRFLDEGRVYLTWGGLNRDLSKCLNRDALRKVLEEVYPNAEPGRIRNNVGQIWAFSHKMNRGDWVVLPSKHKPSISVGEITGDYTYNPDAENCFYHYRDVRWIERDIPRSNFAQDILYSLGAFMTVCQIKRHDAEKRIHEMAKSGWKPMTGWSISTPVTEAIDATDETDEFTDLERVARDQIAKMIVAKFKGHGMARLVNAILQAQGYTTYISPLGPDKGIDILAAPAPMGFGEPKICVQVKSSDSPLDRPTLDQLIGTMQNVQAQHGLLVSWGGFKATVDKEKAVQFFRVRLWDQDDLIDNLLDNYQTLDEDVRAELPLKLIWSPAVSEAEDE